MLGAIIEKLSGLSWEEYVRKHIWEPAGMKDTRSWSPLEEVVPKMAIGYHRAADDLFGTRPRQPYWTFIGMRGNASGGQYSNALDLYRFLRALPSLVSPQRIREFTTVHGPRPEYGYGFGVRKLTNATAIGHGGGGGASGIANDAWTVGEWTIVVQSNYEGGTTAIAEAVMKFLGR